MLVYLIILSVTIVSHNYATINVKQESHERIERDQTQANKYPFLAYVNIGNSSCAGAILSDSWVITAKACGNTTAQEAGWVYAGGRSGVQRRGIARQLSCPDDHRLLLLQLVHPLVFDDVVSAVPIVQPGTFSEHDGPCDVITLGAEPSERSLDAAHAVETRLAAGNECAGPASATSAADQSSTTAVPALHPARDATTAKAAAAGAAAARQAPSKAIRDSDKVTGDAGKKKGRDSRSLDATSPELVDADLLCSPDITQEATSLKHLGSPVVCEGILIALVTPKPSDRASRVKKEDSKTYYTAIGPDYSWITENVPGVQVVSWNEAAKKSRSVLSEVVGSGAGAAGLRKYKTGLSNARKRRLSRLANIIAGIEPGKDSSETAKLELADELEPHLRLNKIFSVWFPLARRVRGIILLNRMFIQPQSDSWGDVEEKAEAALRPLRRVKRSDPQAAAEGSADDARAARPLLQPRSFRRAKRGDSAPKQPSPRSEEVVVWHERSAGGETSAQRPSAAESNAPHATSKLVQRLTVRDKPSVAARWRDRHHYTVTTA